MDNVFLVSGRKLKITSYSYIAISLICFSFQQQERLKEKKDDAYFCLVNNLNSNIPLLGVFYICLQAVTVMT